MSWISRRSGSDLAREHARWATVNRMMRALQILALAGGAGLGATACLHTRGNDRVEQGTAAPDFALPDDRGNMVRLSELLADGKPLILVFYRGFW